MKGIFFIAIFGFIFFRHSWDWFWFFPLFFLGIIPLIRHFTRGSRDSDLEQPGNYEEDIEESGHEIEKQVLKAAKKNNGVVTPALVVLDSSLSLEEAERILQSLVKRGYASMEVTESGQLEYRFAEFLPPGEYTN